MQVCMAAINLTCYVKRQHASKWICGHQPWLFSHVEMVASPWPIPLGRKKHRAMPLGEIGIQFFTRDGQIPDRQQCSCSHGSPSPTNGQEGLGRCLCALKQMLLGEHLLLLCYGKTWHGFTNAVGMGHCPIWRSISVRPGDPASHCITNVAADGSEIWVVVAHHNPNSTTCKRRHI